MAIGPGKYDRQLVDALRACGKTEGILIVVETDGIAKMAAQLSVERVFEMSTMLRKLASELEQGFI